MASPQPTDAHLRVAHSINEAIMLRDFSKRQRKILDLILRLSWGCGKKIAIIPRQRDFEVIGLREGHVATELKWLEESKIIFRGGSEYQFNKDFDQWQISRVCPYEPEKLTELVRINLNGTYQNGKPDDEELTETVSDNLPNGEVGTYHHGKFSTSKLASPKERGGEEGGNGTPPLPIKENIKKDIYINNKRGFKKCSNDPNKFTGGELGHLVCTSAADLEELRGKDYAERIAKIGGIPE